MWTRGIWPHGVACGIAILLMLVALFVGLPDVHAPGLMLAVLVGHSYAAFAGHRTTRRQP